MSESLAAAINSLYAVFARVPRPSSIEYCQCCFTPEDERAVLTDMPVRQLPADALRPYAADVMLTVGGVADFRYFLPRLLEIACGEGFSWPDLESVVGRLRFAGWRSWQDDERDAVRDFLAALWANALAGDPDQEDVDTILCAIGNAEDDLKPYLTEWASALTRPTAGPAAAAQLRSLLDGGYRSDRGKRRLTNAFWEDRDHQAEQVIAWLSSADLQVTLSAAFEAADSEETLQTLADIDDLV
ncbi:hypothetical protein ACIBSW_23825 [Actinoplanes sp. NPDC049668]|uniref:hypothetical protein n=1 Tax=unclassified Actinoplanes TaxID=2626549 RepID=UPI0033AE2B78